MIEFIKLFLMAWHSELKFDKHVKYLRNNI